MAALIFKQFFDKGSSTYTYFMADLASRVGVLIDTVEEHVERDLKTVRDLDLKKIYLINTHIHADHVTGNWLIKKQFENAESVISKYYQNVRADKLIGEEDTIQVGSAKLNFLHTPGHTSGCLCIVDHDNRRVFTGDTLMIRGCGRTDFQGGSAEQLYESVHGKIFTLPQDYLVFPAHDYNGKTSSTVGEEITHNPRLTKSKPEFIEIMLNLNLPYPKLIDVAVPRNIQCGS